MNRRFMLGNKPLQLDATRLLPLLKDGGIGGGGGDTSGPACWIYMSDYASASADLPDFIDFDGEYFDTDGMWPHTTYGSQYISFVKDGVYSISVDSTIYWTGSPLASNQLIIPYTTIYGYDGVEDDAISGIVLDFGRGFDILTSNGENLYSTGIYTFPMHAHELSHVELYGGLTIIGGASKDYEYIYEAQVYWISEL